MGYTTNNMMIYMGLSENGRVYPNGEAHGFEVSFMFPCIWHWYTSEVGALLYL